MRNDTETKVIDRSQTIVTRSRFNHLPYCITLAVIAVLIITVGWQASRTKKASVTESASTARIVENDVKTPVPVKAPEKCRHVIFRLGDDEIFRFTYEDGVENRRFSFEVLEGGL